MEIIPNGPRARYAIQSTKDEGEKESWFSLHATATTNTNSPTRTITLEYIESREITC